MSAVFADTQDRYRAWRPRWKIVLEDVSRRRRVSVTDILGRARFKHIVVARHEVFFLLHEEGFNNSQIARWFGRDRTTILWACHAHLARLGDRISFAGVDRSERAW